ncbi:ArsR family transcriptional regulator [Sphaerisporangium album]|uniref:ArsR family transcriptional regulator n=1 Tax=Sphaerisporangium album TaxID=509200 RepID=A0A367FS89_9ACTN|nr:metalloregulator ArsR/SmtB family transcription factor [Sphaerisporangium album]RCG33094.1 ArsR family transcriptional regulator [Sphaerisporangium album]
MSSSRELAHPEPAEMVVTDVLFALSDPARLALVRRLAEGPLEVANCQPAGGEIPKSTLSHQLKTLREAGVIRNVPSGRQRYVSLRREDLESRFPGLLAAILAEPGETGGDRHGRPSAASPG